MGLMNIYEIWASIQDFFSWEKIQKLYPEGKGIYELFEIDLSTAHIDRQYNFNGNQLIITDCEAQAYLRLNNIKNDLIDINVVRNIGPTPFKEFYITNSASVGKTLKILAGAGGLFNCNQTQLIDLIAQSINRLIIQDNDGGIESSNTSGTSCLHDSETTIHSYSGSGSLRYVIFNTTGAQVGVGASLSPRIYIDGTVMNPIFTFGTYSAQGFNSNSAPRQLLTYDADGTCTLLLYFAKGIVFDSSLSIRVNNHSGANDYTINTSWFYQALT
jgi:hypothetical protein